MACGGGLAEVGELGHGGRGDSYSAEGGGNITKLLLLISHYCPTLLACKAYRGGKKTTQIYTKLSVYFDKNPVHSDMPGWLLISY